MRDVQFLGAFTDETERLLRRITDLERQVTTLAVENARLRSNAVTDRHTSAVRAAMDGPDE